MVGKKYFLMKRTSFSFNLGFKVPTENLLRLVLGTLVVGRWFCRNDTLTWIMRRRGCLSCPYGFNCIMFLLIARLQRDFSYIASAIGRPLYAEICYTKICVEVDIQSVLPHSIDLLTPAQIVVKIDKVSLKAS